MSDVGDSIDAKNANWKFDGKVSKNFDSHVSRSVPMYYEGHDLVIKLSDYFLGDDSVCYDIGCSTGTLTKGLAERNIEKNVKVIGVESQEGMADKAREKCKKLYNVEILQEDVLDLKLEKADMIVFYYVMQFIKPKHRQILVDKIYESLNWGGALILFEKVRASDARFQDIMSNIYLEYKLDNNYSPDEILAKTRSLKGVLEPFSTNGNIDLLKRSGFVDIISIMKYVSFEGFLAIK